MNTNNYFKRERATVFRHFYELYETRGMFWCFGFSAVQRRLWCGLRQNSDRNFQNTQTFYCGMTAVQEQFVVAFPKHFTFFRDATLGSYCRQVLFAAFYCTTRKTSLSFLKLNISQMTKLRNTIIPLNVYKKRIKITLFLFKNSNFRETKRTYLIYNTNRIFALPSLNLSISESK